MHTGAEADMQGPTLSWFVVAAVSCFIQQSYSLLKVSHTFLSACVSSVTQELEADMQAACKDLSLPLPIPVSVLLGSLGHAPEPAAAAAAGGSGSNVFVSMLLAALHPEGHIPDTPARKVTAAISFLRVACYSEDTSLPLMVLCTWKMSLV